MALHTDTDIYKAIFEQEKTMTPSKAYLHVADKVQQWIKENAK